MRVIHDDRQVEVPRDVVVAGDDAVKAYLDEHLYNVPAPKPRKRGDTAPEVTE